MVQYGEDLRTAKVNKYEYVITPDVLDNDHEGFRLVVPYKYAKQLFEFMTREYNEMMAEEIVGNMEGYDIEDYEIFKELTAKGIVTEQEIYSIMAKRYEDFMYYDCGERENRDWEEVFHDVIDDYKGELV